MEQHQFRILSTKKPVDLIPYIQQYVQQFPQVEILVSCDSQNKKRDTNFGLTLALYRPGHGAHVLFNRHSVLRIRDNYSRLIQEVWKSIELAEYVREQTNIKARFIDIDINGKDIYDSNKVLRQALGMGTSFNYDVRYKHKPGEPALLIYAADKISRKK